MPYYSFHWNDVLIEHLAQHGITPEEFESVVRRPEDVDVSDSTGRPIVWGHLPDGRYVLAVFEFMDEVTVLPVTAYEVPEPRE